MTNYNDGNWHGWNGGGCPVHPETEVEWVHMCGEYKGNGCADDFEWGVGVTGIVAFRVLKEHKEPREFWVHLDTEEVLPYSKMANAQQFKDSGFIHVREVTK